MKIEELLDSVKLKINDSSTINEVEKIKAEFLGKDSVISKKMEELRTLNLEEKKIAGKLINEVKDQISEIILSKRQKIEEIELEKKLESEAIDITIPGKKLSVGSIHPISQAIDEMLQIFSHFGFEIKDGPNIEDDWHNFTALNVPEYHPAKLMQDSFYLNSKTKSEINPQTDNRVEDKAGDNVSDEAGDNVSDLDSYNNSIIATGRNAQKLLRTHTSTVQIRSMLEYKEKGYEPPLRFVSFGRVYRKDSDVTHTPMFHQMEGVVIGENINLGHLKGFLQEFTQLFFEKNVKVRFRPSFFPFTEPSAEVDISLDEGNKWLEVLGSGMIHPNVLKNVQIDPEKFQGFAFGLGIERFAMLKYNIQDLRHLFSSDIRLNTRYNFSGFDIPSIIGGLSKCE